MMRSLLLAAVAFAILSQDATGQLFRRFQGGQRARAGVAGKCGDLSCGMCYPNSPVARTFTQRPAPVRQLVCNDCRGSVVARGTTKDVDPFFGTPPSGVKAFVDLCGSVIRMGPTDVFYDIGCGNGEILLSVYDRYRCACIGVERDRIMAARAFQRIRQRRLTKQITILRTDARHHSALYAAATVVYMYLPQKTLAQVVPLLDQRAIIVSYKHAVPGCRQRRHKIGGEVFYFVTP